MSVLWDIFESALPCPCSKTGKCADDDPPECIHGVSIYERCMECWPEETELEIPNLDDSENQASAEYQAECEAEERRRA